MWSPSSFTQLCLPSDSPGCWKPLRIYPWGNSEQDLPPQTLSPCFSLPLGFAQAQKQGGDHKHSLLLPKRSFCNLSSCWWAWNWEVGEVGMTESGSRSLSLLKCKMHLYMWGFQYKAASGSASPWERGQGQDAVLPRATFIPLPGGHKTLKDPALSTTGGERMEINPQTFNFLSFPFIFELAFSVCHRDTDS